MLVQVTDFGAAGGAFLTILPRSAGSAASLHPRTITAAETADKRDLLISLMSPHPIFELSDDEIELGAVLFPHGSDNLFWSWLSTERSWASAFSRSFRPPMGKDIAFAPAADHPARGGQQPCRDLLTERFGQD